MRVATARRSEAKPRRCNGRDRPRLWGKERTEATLQRERGGSRAHRRRHGRVLASQMRTKRRSSSLGSTTRLPWRLLHHVDLAFQRTRLAFGSTGAYHASIVTSSRALRRSIPNTKRTSKRIRRPQAHLCITSCDGSDLARSAAALVHPTQRDVDWSQTDTCDTGVCNHAARVRSADSRSRTRIGTCPSNEERLVRAWNVDRTRRKPSNDRRHGAHEQTRSNETVGRR